MPGEDDRFVVYLNPDGSKRVVRIESRGDEGKKRWEPVSEHFVDQGRCDCEGFHHKKTCAHLIACESVVGRLATVGEARMILRDLLAWEWRGRIPEDSIRQDSEGRVTEIVFEIPDPGGRMITTTYDGIRVRLRGVSKEILS